MKSKKMDRLYRAAVLCVFLVVGAKSYAGLMYDFSWDSTGATPSTPFYELTGLVELNPSVSVGSAFNTDDIMSVSFSVFVDGVFEGTGAFPNGGFNEIEGIRLASSLALTDFFVVNVSGTNRGFGCSEDDCSNGQVDIPRLAGGFDSIDFASQVDAQTAFRATGIPGPATFVLFGLGLAGLGLSRRAKSAVSM